MNLERRTTRRTGDEGLISLDFIFALMLAFGFSMLLFSVTVTLSLVEVSQYITFAVSRTYSAAGETPDDQDKLAKAKFKEMLGTGVFKRIYGFDWIALSAPQLGDFSDEYTKDEDKGIYIGARVPMNANLLHLNIPFLGPTIENSKVGSAVLNSYLGREVSTTECRDNFNKERWNRLKQLSNYSQAQGSGAVLITDNGC